MVIFALDIDAKYCLWKWKSSNRLWANKTQISKREPDNGPEKIFQWDNRYSM